MKVKAVFRRNFPAIQVWSALSPLFLMLYGMMVFSSYSFFIALFYFCLAILGSFLIIAFIPAMTLELIRRFSARLWKQGKWLSIAERKKTRFNPL